jgi:flagellar biogenesis protein FliO
MSVFCLIMFEASASSTSLWLDYTKTLLVLVGICLFALVTVKVLLPRLTGVAKSVPNHIQILGRYPLEPRKTLYLVRTGKTIALLATSAEAVHFMTTLNSEDFENIVAQTSTDVTNGSAFQRIARCFADRKQDTSR